MDANKDEAIKCLKIAKNAIKSGDTYRTRALKFLNKARRLDPSIEIDEEFLSKLNALQPEDHKNPNETTNQKPPSNPLTSAEMKRKKEQVAVVREIERKNDYYEILGLEKNSSAEDIRKAYRKLSLKVHPDKNGAPGAEDSFKKVSNAFQYLSNEERRRKYDLETSPANKRVRVSSVSRSSGTIVRICFGVDANVKTMFYQPYTMEEVMKIVRSSASMFKLSGNGNLRLKYEYQGKTILLPKEDDLEADNELRTCIHRLTSTLSPNISYITIFGEMI